MNIHDFHLAWAAGAQQFDGRWQQLGTALPLAMIPEWVAAAGAFVGPFVGLLGALWLYAKRSEDEKRRQEEENREAPLRQLQAEFGADQQIIQRSLASIDHALTSSADREDANEPIYDEEFYLAPLFASSWEALTQTDAHRVLTSARLEQLSSATTPRWRGRTGSSPAYRPSDSEHRSSERSKRRCVRYATRAKRSTLLPSNPNSCRAVPKAETSDSDCGSD